MTKISITPDYARLLGGDNIYEEVSVRLGEKELDDKLIIEQIYDELKEWLQEYLISEQNNLNNVEIVLEDLKAKFAKQLIINSLK